MLRAALGVPFFDGEQLVVLADDLDRRINELIQSYRTYLLDQPDDVSAYILYGKLLRTHTIRRHLRAPFRISTGKCTLYAKPHRRLW